MDVDKMTHFGNYYKLLSLLLSDQVSSLLKFNFDMKEVDCRTTLYAQFSQMMPDFLFVGLYKYKSRGLLLFIDPKIVYMLSNRMLGGQGTVETKPTPMFTFSETFFGKELVSWFTQYYQKSGVPVSFLRVENQIDHIHYFFPDEEVAVVSFTCKYNGEPIGQIALCHPREFVEKEPLICDFS